MDTQTVTKEITIDAFAPSVWKALTDKEEMKQWYFDIDHFEAKPDFEFQFLAGDEQEKFQHLCKVTEVIPEKKLSYTWAYEKIPGASSLLTFELFEEEGGKTRVKLTHEGLESFGGNGPKFTKESFTGGWEHFTKSLKTYLEKPRHTIEKSILIDAPTSRVWEVVTNLDLIKEWAVAFFPGTYVDSTWQEGSDVTWRFENGSPCAKGVVAVNIPQKSLKVAFYDNIQEEECNKDSSCVFNFSHELGPYRECFELTEQDGKTLLQATVGPLSNKFYACTAPLWERAVPLIKEICERKN